MTSLMNRCTKIAMGNALTDGEIMKLVDKKARLVTHDEIKNYKDMKDLLGKNKACIILYVSKILPDNSIYGHWCCVFKAGWDKNCICYFDPYGEIPDYHLRRMSPEAIKEFGNHPFLSEKLRDYAKGGKYVVYNNSRLQKYKEGDAICGRMTGLRLQFRDIDGFKFDDLMNSYSNKGISSDELATLLTSFLR